MEGQKNPYLAETEFALPEQAYTITIIDEQGAEQVLTIEPDKIPFEDHGLPGSILDICLGHGIELDHACGGVCACSTCHVHVLEGLESCNESSDEEEDQLEQAYDLKPSSRLGCQCIPNGTKNVTIRIPQWNRNLAREAHGADSMTTKSD
ncbi:MAG: 2Fe-2S iron-sulfur cluster-binding protein [Phycisphaerae bacterium]